MWTLGTPRLGLNSQPLTTGAWPRGRDRTSAEAAFGSRWPEEDEAVGLAPLQHQRVLLLAFVVVLGVAEQHRVAGAQRRALDALQDQREERVGDVGDGDQHLAGAQRAQALGGGVRRVAERLDRRHHRGPRLGVDHVGTARARATPSRWRPRPLVRRRGWWPSADATGLGPGDWRLARPVAARRLSDACRRRLGAEPQPRARALASHSSSLAVARFGRRGIPSTAVNDYRFLVPISSVDSTSSSGAGRCTAV